MTHKFFFYKLFLLLVFIFQFNFAYSQREGLQQDSLVKRLKVEFKECYASLINGNQISGHSNLIHKTNYNKIGNPKNIHTYDSIGISSTVEYKYHWNDKLSEETFTFRDAPELNYSTKYEYDLRGLKAYERLIRNKKMEVKTDFFYSKNGILKKKVEHYFIKTKASIRTHKYIYDNKGRLIKRTATGYTYVANKMSYDYMGHHSKTVRINKNGQKIPYLKHEYNLKNRLSKTTEFIYSSPFPKESEPIETKTTIYTYKENGLVATKKVLKNGNLVYFWEYEYTFFEMSN